MNVQDTAVALLALYSEADADTIKRGRRWYVRARRECQLIARDTGYTLEHVAAVCAITSPDAQLVQNLRWTRTACETRGAEPVGRYPAQMTPKVRAALADKSDPLQYATGPKVSAFARAILGDRDALVIDRWAAYAAGIPRSAKLGPKQRRAIEEAYRRAAAAVGESVRDFQAIVWEWLRAQAVATRGGRPVQVRYADL